MVVLIAFRSPGSRFFLCPSRGCARVARSKVGVILVRTGKYERLDRYIIYERDQHKEASKWNEQHYAPSMVTNHDSINTTYATGAPKVAKSTLPFCDPVSAR